LPYSRHFSLLPPKLLMGLVAAWLIVMTGQPALCQTAVYQINCGGPAVNPFIADNYFTGGNPPYSTTSTIDTSGAINPALTAVYQTCRYDVNGGEPFSYTFPTLTAGAAYTVRFHFADIFGDGPGTDLFTFKVNGSTVRSNYDVSAFAGAGYKAVIVAANTTADASGNITLNFSNGSVGPYDYCNGIEILTGNQALNSAPTGLKATAASNGVNISWQALSGVIGYNVLRSTNDGPFVRINPSTITGTSYHDTSPGSCTSYEVLAVNNIGEGPASTPLTTNTFALSVTPSPLMVTHGSSIAATVSVSAACFPFPFTLSVSAPNGITAWCFPNSVNIAYPVTTPTLTVPLDYPNAVLNIVVGSNVAPGNYNVTVTGKSTNDTVSVMVPITVN